MQAQRTLNQKKKHSVEQIQSYNFTKNVVIFKNGEDEVMT